MVEVAWGVRHKNNNYRTHPPRGRACLCPHAISAWTHLLLSLSPSPSTPRRRPGGWHARDLRMTLYRFIAFARRLGGHIYMYVCRSGARPRRAAAAKSAGRVPTGAQRRARGVPAACPPSHAGATHIWHQHHQSTRHQRRRDGGAGGAPPAAISIVT